MTYDEMDDYVLKLEKDAARYRWLRECDMREAYSKYWNDDDALTPELDTAIDHAMKGQT